MKRFPVLLFSGAVLLGAIPAALLQPVREHHAQTLSAAAVTAPQEGQGQGSSSRPGMPSGPPGGGLRRSGLPSGPETGDTGGARRTAGARIFQNQIPAGKTAADSRSMAADTARAAGTGHPMAGPEVPLTEIPPDAGSLRNSEAARRQRGETFAPGPETEPRFRPVAAAPGPHPPPDGVAGPVVLEFSDGQPLPAVLAAPDGPAPAPGAAGSRRQEQENRIAADFVSAVTGGPSAAVTGGDPAAGTAPEPGNPPPATSAGGEENSQGNGINDQRWAAAVREADEQYRVLAGQDAYLKKSLEAALLKRRASTVPVPVPGP